MAPRPSGERAPIPPCCSEGVLGYTLETEHRMARDTRRMRHREDTVVERGRCRQDQQNHCGRQRNYQRESVTSREPKPKEKSRTAEIRRWSKGFCGCLIVLGIVFVFYVITTLIIDNSSPFDFLLSQLHNEGNMMHQGRETELHTENVMSSSRNINDSSKITVSDYKNVIVNQTDGQNLHLGLRNKSAISPGPSSYLESRANSAYFPATPENEGDIVKSSLKHKRQEPTNLEPSNDPVYLLNTDSIPENGRSIGMAGDLRKLPLYVPRKNKFLSPRSGFTIRDKLHNHRVPIFKRKKNDEKRTFRRRPSFRRIFPEQEEKIPPIETRSFQQNPVSKVPRGKPIPLVRRKTGIILPNQRNSRPGPPHGRYRGPTIDRTWNLFRPPRKRKVSSLSSPYSTTLKRRSSFNSPHPKLIHESHLHSSRLPNRRPKYPSSPRHASYPGRRRRPVREGYQKLIPPERFRYPPTAASIQDIIEYMSEAKASNPELTHQNTQGYSLTSFHSQRPPELIIGAQDHILPQDSSYPDISDNWQKVGVDSDLRIFPNSYEHVGTFHHTNVDSHFTTDQRPNRNVHRTQSNSGNTIRTQVLPPVRNTYNPHHDITPQMNSPFELRLDIYPITDHTSGSSDIQSFVSVVGNTAQGSYPSVASRQKIILHLNFFSQAPSQRSQSRQGSSGPESEMALEIPLRGHLSPLDIYKWVVRTAENRPIAYPRKGTISEEDNERQMSPFPIEPGPALYAAIEQGLKEVNPHLPPESKVIFSEVTEEELLNIKNSLKDSTPSR